MPRTSPARVLPAPLVLLALAACADAPAAPALDAAPPAAAAAPTPEASASAELSTPILDLRVGVEVRVASQSPSPAYLPGATIRFTLGSQVLDVADGSANDHNPLPGYVRAKALLASGASLKACVLVPPPDHGLAGMTCVSGTYAGASPTILGVLSVPRKPRLTLRFENTAGQLLAGGVATIAGPNGFSKTLGNALLPVSLGQPGTYSVCETTRPTGYMWASPACRTLVTQWGGTYDVEFTHLPMIIVQAAR